MGLVTDTNDQICYADKLTVCTMKAVFFLNSSSPPSFISLNIKKNFGIQQVVRRGDLKKLTRLI